MRYGRRASSALVVAVVCLATGTGCLGLSRSGTTTEDAPAARPTVTAVVPPTPATTRPTVGAVDLPVDGLWSCADATLGRSEINAERCARG